MIKRYTIPGCLLVVIVVVLSGCAKPQAVPAPEVPKQVSCDDVKLTSNREECLRTTSVIVLDYLYREITETFDVARCPELIQEDRIQSCQSFIADSGVQGPVAESDLLLMRSVQTAKDVAQCTSINNASYAQYCQRSFQDDRLKRAILELLPTGDINRCKEFELEADRQQCERLFQTVSPQPINP